MSWIRLAARVVLVMAGATSAARGQSRKTCRNYNCDGVYRCDWTVSKTQSPSYESLDESKRVGRSLAQYRGHCDASARPFDLDGYAISPGSRITLTQASKAAAIARWEVHHTRQCPACTHTEGRGRAQAQVSFKARAQISDPPGSDARAEAYGTLAAGEATTGCATEASGGVVVASSGAVVVGASSSPVGSGGSIGWTRNLGNTSEIEELFHDDDDTPDVEKNDYYVTMTASIDRALLAADGWLLGMAQSGLEIEPTAFELTLYLSCDYCNHPSSKAELHFPR